MRKKIYKFPHQAFLFLTLSFLFIIFSTGSFIRKVKDDISDIAAQNLIMGISLGNTSVFDWAIGNTSVWLSAGAYCETDTYLTRPYKGYSTGFIPTHIIDALLFDVQVLLLLLYR